MKDKYKNLYRNVKEFINKLEHKNTKPLFELTPEEARKVLVEIQESEYEELPADIWDTQIITTLAGNVEIRFIRPKDSKGQKLPLIIYCHGGGWILGDSFTHDILLRKLAAYTNSCIAFINYPRSPEMKYPAALNQIYAALDFLFNNPDEYDINTEKIVLAGDSAGANMAISTAIKAKKENSIKILFNLLLYPAIDINMDSKSYNKFEKGPWLSKKAMKWFWNAYIDCEENKKDIYFAPYLAEIDDLIGLAPTLIITAENDVLRDEGEKFALKLDAAGVKCTCIRVLGTCHDFMMLNPLKETEPTLSTFKIISCFLNNIFVTTN